MTNITQVTLAVAVGPTVNGRIDPESGTLLLSQRSAEDIQSDRELVTFEFRQEGQGNPFGPSTLFGSDSDVVAQTDGNGIVTPDSIVNSLGNSVDAVFRVDDEVVAVTPSDGETTFLSSLFEGVNGTSNGQFSTLAQERADLITQQQQLQEERAIASQQGLAPDAIQDRLVESRNSALDILNNVTFTEGSEEGIATARAFLLTGLNFQEEQNASASIQFDASNPDAFVSAVDDRLQSISSQIAEIDNQIGRQTVVSNLTRGETIEDREAVLRAQFGASLTVERFDQGNSQPVLGDFISPPGQTDGDIEQALLSSVSDRVGAATTPGQDPNATTEVTFRRDTSDLTLASPTDQAQARVDAARAQLDAFERQSELRTQRALEPIQIPELSEGFGIEEVDAALSNVIDQFGRNGTDELISEFIVATIQLNIAFEDGP